MPNSQELRTRWCRCSLLPVCAWIMTTVKPDGHANEACWLINSYLHSGTLASSRVKYGAFRDAFHMGPEDAADAIRRWLPFHFENKDSPICRTIAFAGKVGIWVMERWLKENCWCIGFAVYLNDADLLLQWWVHPLNNVVSSYNWKQLGFILLNYEGFNELGWDQINERKRRWKVGRSKNAAGMLLMMVALKQ